MCGNVFLSCFSYTLLRSNPEPTRTFKKGNIKQFELSRVKLNRKRSEGNENYFELAGGSSYRGFELPGDDCITGAKKIIRSTEDFVI